MENLSAAPAGYIIRNLHSPWEYVSAFEIDYDGSEIDGVCFDMHPLVFPCQADALQAFNAIPPEDRSGFTILRTDHPRAQRGK